VHPEQLQFGQTTRSGRELDLPDYALKELDMARAGYDLFGNQISHDQKQAIFDRWFGPVKVKR
jgi:hypothetical protein